MESISTVSWSGEADIALNLTVAGGKKIACVSISWHPRKLMLFTEPGIKVAEWMVKTLLLAVLLCSNFLDILQHVIWTDTAVSLATAQKVS